MMMDALVKRRIKPAVAVISSRLLQWAHRGSPLGVLFVLAFIGSAFVPLPVELMLIALVHAVPHRWIKLSATMAAGSFIGGIVTYLIGYFLLGFVEPSAVTSWGLTADWQRVWSVYRSGWGATVIAAVAFGGGPYKIATIAAGATRMDFLLFASVLGMGRIGRFLLVAASARRDPSPSIPRWPRSLRIVALIVLGVTAVSAVGFAALF
ncbi:MAG: DedA family protein [Acidobacteria bacterium]|nr:MAG: DedA family protein [Acidobacteriota bacterium]